MYYKHKAYYSTKYQQDLAQLLDISQHKRAHYVAKITELITLGGEIFNILQNVEH